MISEMPIVYLPSRCEQAAIPVTSLVAAESGCLIRWWWGAEDLAFCGRSSAALVEGTKRPRGLIILGFLENLAHVHRVDKELPWPAFLTGNSGEWRA